MKTYYVNHIAQSNGDHEVHMEDCDYMPVLKKQLGEFESCEEAVLEAKKVHFKSNGCKFCCKECHSS